MFRFDFQRMGGFDLFVTGRSHFILGEHALSFNNVMITQTGIVELASVEYRACADNDLQHTCQSYGDHQFKRGTYK